MTIIIDIEFILIFVRKISLFKARVLEIVCNQMPIKEHSECRIKYILQRQQLKLNKIYFKLLCDILSVQQYTVLWSLMSDCLDLLPSTCQLYGLGQLHSLSLDILISKQGIIIQLTYFNFFFFLICFDGCDKMVHVNA